MIFVLIPFYNEAENIQELASSLLANLEEGKRRFVFVDDCSTDGTITMLEKHFPASELTILRNPKNSGPGYSFNTGFEYILSKSTSLEDLVITLEGDNTSDIKILAMMISLCSQWNFDLILASVYAQGGGFQKTSFIRKIISLVANQILRANYNIKVLTLSSFYRVYKISVVKNIKQHFGEIIKESGFICALEILLKSIHVNARIIEVPMLLNSFKRKGKSKMKILRTTIAYLRFLLTYRTK
jgi:dolichol-phosphate mannosyltransferase